MLTEKSSSSLYEGLQWNFIMNDDKKLHTVGSKEYASCDRLNLQKTQEGDIVHNIFLKRPGQSSLVMLAFLLPWIGREHLQRIGDHLVMPYGLISLHLGTLSGL